MKILYSKNININNDVLGKITFSRRELIRKNLILVTDKVQRWDIGYKAIILISKEFDKKSNVFLSEENKGCFAEGDVVFIQRNGQITFWYEINSDDNVIVATESCNHKCIMCPQPIRKDIDKRHELNLKLISLISKNTKRLCITGGEPSLLGDKLVELVECIKTNLPNASLDILTNGTMFANKDLAFKLSMCIHPDLQIDIPIFSDIPSIHNRIVGANTFYKTVSGIFNLAIFHLQIGLRIVIHKQTYQRLPMLAEYIYRNFPFVAQVAFMEMETNANAEENIEQLWIDPYDYNKELKEAVNILHNRGINVLIYNAQLCVLDSSLRNIAVQSISKWKNIFLDDCKKCVMKEKCCGFFESNRRFHSAHIQPIKLYEK